MNKAMLKMIVGMVGPETITSAISELLKSGTDYIESHTVQSGESERIGILFKSSAEQYKIAIAFTDEQNRIIRMEKPISINELAEKLKENIK